MRAYPGVKNLVSRLLITLIIKFSDTCYFTVRADLGDWSGHKIWRREAPECSSSARQSGEAQQMSTSTEGAALPLPKGISNSEGICILVSGAGASRLQTLTTPHRSHER